MKNKLVDLNNHLFEQLERLNDDDLDGEQLSHEVTRADAMCKLAGQIVDVAHVAIDSAKLCAEYGGNYEGMLPMVEGKDKVNDEMKAIEANKGEFGAPAKGKRA